MESSWLFLNIDELFYRFYLLFSTVFGWIWYVISLQWVFGDSSAAQSWQEGSLGISPDAGFFDRFFGSGLFRVFHSQPSETYDSVQEYLNPTADKNFFEIMWGIISGTGDKESIITLMFGTFFGWVIILAICGIILKLYLKNKIHFMEHKHALLYDLAQDNYHKGQANNKSERWQKIVSQVNADDANSWKIAVMDADILLDEILSEQGYAGDTLADKLKDAQKDSLTTLQYAWEGHAIRNKIAHHGDYVLTNREAKTAISMFEKFFNELYHI